MRITLYIVLVLTLFFQGCDDFQWDLERDNPLDSEVDVDSEIEFSMFEVYEDNNDDKQINKGESIKLKIFLKNNGKRANGVKATITCSSTYISELTPTTAVSYSTSSYSDYIDSGDEGSPSSASSYLSFNVSSETPEGTVITFNLVITDESGNTWTDSFDITVTSTNANLEFSRYSVYSDSNDDEKINPGESVQLKVYLKNIGSSRANKVRATITCSDSYISGLSPVTAVAYYDGGSTYYDYIDPDSEGSTYSFDDYPYLSFDVSSSTPGGTTITFNIEITDESGNTWTDSFEITVVSTDANIEFSRYSVYSDSNDDGKINPGESVQLKVYLQNAGTSRANKVRATITCSDSYISGLSPVTAVAYYNGGSTYNDYINPGSEGSTYSFDDYPYLSFDVSSSTPGGTTITFNIEITDESGNTWTDSFDITVVSTDANIEFSRYSVYSDSNDDDKINPGESVQLKVYLQNTGSSRANKVRATITCSDSYISGLSPVTAVAYYDGGSTYYDYIDPGNEGYTYSFDTYPYLSFDVSASTPVGTDITFNIEITDEQTNTWNDSFSITIQ